MSDIDQETRLAVIRDICRKEGHGELVDISVYGDCPPGSNGRRAACRRGCNVAIWSLERAVTLDELDAWLKRQQITGTVRLHGTIEVER